MTCTELPLLVHSQRCCIVVNTVAEVACCARLTAWLTDSDSPTSMPDVVLKLNRKWSQQSIRELCEGLQIMGLSVHTAEVCAGLHERF